MLDVVKSASGKKTWSEFVMWMTKNTIRDMDLDKKPLFKNSLEETEQQKEPEVSEK